MMEQKHLSFSRFKRFEQCEAAALADWQPVSKQALLEGKYFEAYLTDADLIQFGEDHPEIYKKGGTILKKAYADAGETAEKLLEHDEIRYIINRCVKQMPVSGEIAGVPFIGYIDLFDKKTGDQYDIKYMRSFAKLWSPVEYAKVDWYFAYGYHYQAAIYRELTKGIKSCGKQHIIAATKETVPDFGFWQFDDKVLDDALGIVEAFSPRYYAILNGEIEPKRCEHCEYCRSTRVLDKPIIIDMFG